MTDDLHQTISGVQTENSSQTQGLFQALRDDAAAGGCLSEDGEPQCQLDKVDL